ncbi:MAG: hypothetical protein ACRDMV_20735 [Streptosporangiales bacterium]
MGFGAELVFEDVEDRFDLLPDRLVDAVGAEQVTAELIGEEGLEARAGEALVADDDLSGGTQRVVSVSRPAQGRAALDHRGSHTGVQERVEIVSTK